MNSELTQRLDRFAEIGIQNTQLQKESSGLRQDIIKIAQEMFTPDPTTNHIEFFVGSRIWTVYKSKDGKDVNVLYRDIQRLD